MYFCCLLYILHVRHLFFHHLVVEIYQLSFPKSPINQISPVNRLTSSKSLSTFNNYFMWNIFYLLIFPSKICPIISILLIIIDYIIIVINEKGEDWLKSRILPAPVRYFLEVAKNASTLVRHHAEPFEILTTLLVCQA